MGRPTRIQLVSTGIKEANTTDTVGTRYDNDHLFEQLLEQGLVNNRFRAWYCSRFYRLGKTKVLQLAAIAKADGKEPPKLFSKLLKES